MTELLTDLVKQLDSIAAQLAQQEKNLSLGFDGEVQKLQHSFTIIQELLNDADERLFTHQAVMLWFDKLKNAYYMMDDVLDRWNTSRTKSQIQIEENIIAAALKKKVRSFFPSPSICFRHVKNLALRLDIGYKIKKLNETLDKIAKDRVKFGFNLTRQLKLVDRRPTTTFFVDVSEIIGRDNCMQDLLSNLLVVGGQEERNPRVISLVGVGGIGKSTLAQLTYYNLNVKPHFQIRMWVCVSDPFDQCKVAKAIIQEVDPRHKSLNKVTEFQTLLCEIHALIGEKRFFLVLDNVPTDDFAKWEPFKNALKCGAQGSKILVTTRKNSVAEMMESSCTINLRELSLGDCWLIFSKIVFFNKDLQQRRDLEELGRQLANKCKGLPLAAKTLGSLMHFKRSREEWEGVLQSSLWEVEDIEKGFLAPLLLSYCDFPLPLKQCFSYCAVFPKDYLFFRDELVLQWMAQGYIESKENMTMEIIAEEYFEILAKRYFFQGFERDYYDGKIIRCKMHDVVHDFAQSMTKNESFQINGDNNLEIDWESSRHLHLEISSGMQFLEPVNPAKNLRTLFLLSHTSNYEFNMLLFDSFHNFRCLRTLILNYPIEKLPDAIENLIHLRCLHLSAVVRISEFPETLCNLHNLQTLSIEDGCYLKKLPQGLGKLINLRHLKFSRGYSKRVVSPKGIGKLTCLRTLSGFNIGGKDDRKGCKLGELKKLNHLRGTLDIHGLRNVEDVDEVRYAQLKKKIHLRGLELMFGEFGEGIEVEEEDRTRRRMENDVLVLFAIEPPPNLEILIIGEYMGSVVFPSWMMSLTNLKELVLITCWKLEQLPPLGKLPLLEKLKISYASMIRKVGDEFLGIDIEEEELSESSNNKDIIIFPNLKSLRFDKLYEWEEWTGMGGTIEEEEEEDNSANAFVTNNTPKIKIMPRLHSLKIGWCGDLKSLPDYLRNTPLQELDIHGCPILEQRCERGIGDYWPNISHIPCIEIGGEHVQRDGQLPDSIDSEIEDSNDSDEDEEAPEAANAEDSDEDDPSIRTFTTARLDAANAGGGSGSARNTENQSSYAPVKIENSDGTKDGGAQGTSPAGPTAPARSSVPGIVVKEDLH